MKSSSSTASSLAEEAMEELEKVDISQNEKKNTAEAESINLDSPDKPTTHFQPLPFLYPSFLLYQHICHDTSPGKNRNIS